MIGLCSLASPPAAAPPDQASDNRPQSATSATSAAQESEVEKAPAPSFADFRPSHHGFAFVNSFRGSPLPVSLGRLERTLNIPDRFGLCGGMCFAAADYYLAGRDIQKEIPDRHPPENGTPLYQYLYSRQAASLGTMAMMFTKFVEWMDLSERGQDGTHERTLAELPAILEAIQSGKPVMIGLVLVDGRDTREVWRNHQILAYRATTTDDDPPILHIYDPNFPLRDDAVIRWIEDETDPRWERQISGARRDITRIRGFFRMDYTPVEPPLPDGLGALDTNPGKQDSMPDPQP